MAAPARSPKTSWINEYKMQAICPVCSRKHVFDFQSEDAVILDGNPDDTFNVLQEAEGVEVLHPIFVCRNSNCSYEKQSLLVPLS